MAYNNVRSRYINDGAGVVPPARLLVMLYERLILDLEQADTALANQALSVVNDKLLHAQSIILELQSALNLEAWEGAAGLNELYTWFNAELISANVKKDAKPIRSCLKMIRELSSAWEAAGTQLLNDRNATAPMGSIPATPQPVTATTTAPVTQTNGANAFLRS